MKNHKDGNLAKFDPHLCSCQVLRSGSNLIVLSLTLSERN